MKNNFIILILNIFVFTACTSTSENNSKDLTSKRDSIKRDSTIRTNFEKIKLHSNNCQKLSKDSIYIEGLFKAFCPNDTISGVPFGLGKEYPFDTLITKVKDTIIYSFKVSNECCIKYYGKYFTNQDTIVLNYIYCGSPCDCYCDYILTYKIPSKKYKFKHTVIRQIN